MRLFTGFNFIFSQNFEPVISEVDETMQKQRQVDIKQTIPYSDSGATSLAASSTLVIPWSGATTTRQRLLDISVNGSTYVRITQNAVLRQIELTGTEKCPARLTLSLAAPVTAVSIVNRETSRDTEISWMYAEYSSDINNIANFPVV